jgi:AraC family transcriptional activator of pobA
MTHTDPTNVTMKQVCTEGEDFGVNKFERRSLQQIVPFKNSSDQHFAIVLYFDNTSEYSNIEGNVNGGGNGNLIFKSPGEPNKTIVYRDVLNGFYIQFSEKFLLSNRQLLSIITGFPFFEISLLKDKPLVIDAIQSEMLKDLFNKIYEEHHSNQNNDKLEIVNVYLQIFFLNIKRIYESLLNAIELENTIEKKQSVEIVRKFKSLVWLHTISINDKASNRKTVTEYADLLFIHPNYLYAVVKKETGKTAREYIDEQIFKLAKMLLLQEELLIKEIAWQLAFTETAHFTNFFRRHAGIPPGEYRKQHLYDTVSKSKYYVA